ncbi:MAG: regulatory protein RecX [Lachnospiraceae bacterium]|nr:regulatory protein RecX [Lachnospiraceae bacterium]
MNKNKDVRGSRTVSAREKALDILLYRMRSEKELYDKLIEKGYPEEECADAVEYAKHFGYVNDAEYARQYVYSRGISKGRLLLKKELREKGIGDELIEAALEELPESHEVLLSLLEKKYGEPHELDEKEFRRAYSFLLRKGFNNSSVITALKEYRLGGES